MSGDQSLSDAFRDYTKDSTLHGIRYITDKDSYTVRRLCWTAVLGACIGCITFLIVTQLFIYYDYPTIVDLGVTYETEMDFPAVAICNHNPYKLTSLQEHGMLDVVLESYHRASGATHQDEGSGSCSSHESYLLQEGVCSVPDTAFFVEIINEVTSSVCKYLCSCLKNAQCSGYLYKSDSRSCTLTSYTGQQKNDTSVGTGYDCSRSSFYRRVRDLNTEPTVCTFTNPTEDSCHLTVFSTSSNEWQVVTGNTIHPPVRDHTLGLESGYMLALTPTSRRPGVEGKWSSPYMNTEGKCIQLFYMHLESGVGILEVRTLGENLTEVTLFKSEGGAQSSANSQWKPKFIRLEAGIHKVVLRGVRKEGISGIVVDDFRLLPCAEFERNSIFSPSGSEYMGTISTSFRDKPCLYWVNVSSYYTGSEDMFPDESPEKAKNYCRNLQSRQSEPWCLTGPDEVEHCLIPYEDECVTGFKCESTGRCVPAYAVCDGEAHCEDGSDEITPCQTAVRLDCDFEDSFACGYTLSPTSGFMWVPAKGQTWAEQLSLNTDSQNSQYMTVSSGSGSQTGDIATMTSKQYTFTADSLLSFYVKMEVNAQDSDTSLHVHLISPLGSVSNTLLSIRRREDSMWVKYYLCIPAGTHSVMFEAIHGLTGRPVISLDSVTVYDGQMSPPDVTYEILLTYENRQNVSGNIQDTETEDGTSPYAEKGSDPLTEYTNQQNTIAAVFKCDYSLSDLSDYTPGDAETVNCDFDKLKECGYEPKTTSVLYEWKRMPKDFIQHVMERAYEFEGCNGDYYETDGTIESSGYPITYDNNLLCVNTIHQPAGSNLTLTFFDFDVENHTDCKFDSLTIDDGASQNILCGHKPGDSNWPRKTYVTTSETVSLSFRSDYSLTFRGFQLSYETTYMDSVDYVLVAGYHGPYIQRDYQNALVSPSFILNETHCLTFELFLWETFEVMLGENIGFETSYRHLLTASKETGLTWRKVTITLGLRGENLTTAHNVMFNTYHFQPTAAYTAALNNVLLMPGKCQDVLVTSNATGDCDFTDLEQCGYVDVSDGPRRWLRAYSEGSGYSMASVFEDFYENNPTQLLSPHVSLNSSACLSVNVRGTGMYFNISVSKYHSNGTIEKITCVQDLDLMNDTNVTVALDSGSYRILFEALGRYASIHLDNISIALDTVCETMGAPCPQGEPDLAETNEETTTAYYWNTQQTTEEAYVHPVSSLSAEEIDDITYQQLLQETDGSLYQFTQQNAGVSLENTVLKCEWDGRECSPKTFREEFTNVGLCLMFNADENEENRLRIKKSGADSGLQLIINVAEYEYVEGLTTDSGIKVKVFHQSELADLKNSGFAVGPGMHSLVEIEHTVSKFLSDPYGECGTKELRHHLSDDYTYSRCQRECETVTLEAVCECRDIYMPAAADQFYPVCNTTEFFSCILDPNAATSDQVSLPDCETCPAACLSKEYSVLLSYTSISTLSVEALLGDRRATVEQDFRSARDIFDRVTNEPMFETLNSMDTIVSTITELKTVVSIDALDTSTSTFARVEEGIELILGVFQEDTEVHLFGNLSQWIQAYDRDLRGSRSALHGMIGDSKQSLGYIKEVLLWQYGTGDNMLDLQYKYESILSITVDAATDVQRVAMSLDDFGMYFSSISEVDPYQFSAVNDTLIPVKLLYDKDNGTKCEDLKKKLLRLARDIYVDLVDYSETIQAEINSVNDSSQLRPIRDIVPIDDAIELQEQMNALSDVVDLLQYCLTEYEEFVKSVDAWIRGITFPQYSYSQTVDSQAQIAVLDDALYWFQQLNTKYSNGTGDKYYLIDQFSDDKRYAAVADVENVINKIQQSLVIPTRTALDEIERGLKEHYLDGLSNLATVATYFKEKSGEILEKSRQMTLWRQPYASLDNPNIIDFYLTAEEGKRALPPNIHSYIETTASEDINSLINTYFNDLEQNLDDVEVSILELNNRFQAEIQNMDAVLSNFKDRTAFGTDFLKNNILKMDLYFSEIKVAKVEQQKAYDLGTFFGDVGGYLGLLLGASVLTVVEVLDVFINHAATKVCQRKKQKVQHPSHVNDNGNSGLRQTDEKPKGSFYNEGMSQGDAAFNL